MKAGQTLQQLSQNILTQSRAKRDFVVDTRKLRFTPKGTIEFELKGDTHAFKPTGLCLEQIGSRVGIPNKYLDRMAAEAPSLLAANINHWFAANPEQRMLRTLDAAGLNAEAEKAVERITKEQGLLSQARAFLSDRFRPLDNYDLANAVIPKLAKASCNVLSSEITEKRLYIQAATPKLTALIEQRKREGTQHRIGETNDVVQAGVVISNSEVGCGAIKVEPMIYRLVCRNGLIVGASLRKYHVGRAGEGQIGSDDETFELYSDATRRLDDKAFWAKVCDVVDASLDRIKFNATVEKLNNATAQAVGKPKDAVEIVSEKFGLTESESDNVLEHLCNGGDLSKFGMVQAVTRAAEDVPSYDRAIELERIGGLVLELPQNTFDKN